MISIEQLPFTVKKSKFRDYTLVDDLSIGQWIVPKETVVKLSTATNFGFVVLPKGCKDKNGFEIPRRIFKY